MTVDSNVRRQKIRTRDSRVAIIIAALLAIVGTIGAVGSWGAYLTDSRLERSGPRAQGLVAHKRFLLSADGDSDYIVEYSFPLPSGERMQSQRGVSKGLWTGLKEGQSFEVVYSAENPNRNFPLGAGVTSMGVTVFVSVLSGVVAMLGFAILFGLRRSPVTLNPKRS